VFHAWVTTIPPMVNSGTAHHGADDVTARL
jgi:hypothetical protein